MPKWRVLVLEDELFVALQLKQHLATAGHTVVGPAATLPEAEALAAEAAIDRAVLDANVNGEVPRDLTAMLADRGVPFVYVSGYDESFIFGRLPRAPVLPKPVDVQALAAWLDGDGR